MSWDDQLNGFMQNQCMKYGGIFDHYGNPLAATSGFTPSVQEVKSIRDAILSGDTSVTTTGIQLNGDSYTVLVLDSDEKTCLLKSKNKKGQEQPLSGCVVVCPAVVVVGISDDGGVKGAGATSVIRVAKYITDSSRQ